jgi:hypothetical protein
LAQYPSAVSTVFIECSRCELRLPASVKLPPLVPPNGHGVLQPEASNRAIAEAVGGAHVLEEIFQPTPRPPRLPPKKVEEIFQAIRSIETSPAAREAEAPALPTTISGDGDLPCAGQEIALLKPAALAMLIAKVARLAHREGADWAPLLAALTREREARLAKGRRPRAVTDAPG